MAASKVLQRVGMSQVVMARPTGVGRALTTYQMPIEGRDEWIAAARRLGQYPELALRKAGRVEAVGDVPLAGSPGGD